MKYVKIVSKSVTTPEDMFTLGVSTSRGKDDKIGQFGSGTLLGTLAWIRAYGTSPVFMINGKKVTFQTKDILKGDGIPFQQVLMCHSRKKAPLNVALEYGVLDWPTACLGLREWISNALDAGAEPKDILVLTDKIEASDDEVAVFVPYTDLAKEYFDNIGEYFLHFVGKQHEKVIDKPAKSPCRIYRKGVFIRTLGDESLFNYNMAFNINECRTGSSDSLISDIEYEIRFNMGEGQNERVQKVIDAVLIKEKIVETSKTNWHGISSTMRDLLKNMVGKVGICPTNFIVANCTAIAPEWHKAWVKEVPQLDGLTEICKAEIEGFDMVAPTAEITAKYHKYCELIETMGMSRGYVRPKLLAYMVKPDGNGTVRNPRFNGLYDEARKEVMLWAANPNIESVIVHELAHHYTGCADDWTPEFAKFGHDLVAEIVKQLM